MTTEEDRLVTAREAARQGRVRLWLVVFGAGVAVIVAVVVGSLGRDAERALAGSGALAVVLGLLMMLRNRANADTERARKIRGVRDVLQQQRAQSILLLPITSLFLTFKSVEGTWEFLNNRAGDADWLLIPLGPMISILILLMVAGLDNPGDKRMKRLLEDELTRSFRHRTLALALAVLVAGLIAAFGVALWRPAVGIAAIPLVLAIASATAAVRFFLLNRDADPNG